MCNNQPITNNILVNSMKFVLNKVCKIKNLQLTENKGDYLLYNNVK